MTGFCGCVNIDFGSYDRTVSMRDPFNARKRNNGWVTIDICICQEIAELWYLGIPTIESCCGHNKNDGYIMVEEKYEKDMLENNYHPNKKWNKENGGELLVFYPKTTFFNTTT